MIEFGDIKELFGRKLYSHKSVEGGKLKPVNVYRVLVYSKENFSIEDNWHKNYKNSELFESKEDVCKYLMEG